MRRRFRFFFIIDATLLSRYDTFLALLLRRFHFLPFDYLFFHAADCYYAAFADADIYVSFTLMP